MKSVSLLAKRIISLQNIFNNHIFELNSFEAHLQKFQGIFLSLVCSLLSSVSEIEARLPRSQLLVLCRNEAVLKWMSTCDHLMYQALVEILIPDVLRPIPSEPQSHHLSR